MDNMEEVYGFEFSNGLARRMLNNVYCRKIISVVQRFGAVYFQVDDSPEQQEVIELLSEDSSYWELLNKDSSYYLIRDDIAEVRFNATII